MTTSEAVDNLKNTDLNDLKDKKNNFEKIEQ